jgi:hypothetical protein
MGPVSRGIEPVAGPNDRTDRFPSDSNPSRWTRRIGRTRSVTMTISRARPTIAARHTAISTAMA